ncbi:hypothetical protein PZB74_16130 [Porifericola rhodea]|uniref:O-antigen ligase family protein n=1 Tax=Porifericola rhodea TaxID=930972 RepID=UPI002666A5CD|nr:hypothetical protein [Porifericola rhodea]WKN30494.1 hypothetical protein PZB74_16130 [Porifericola rhodea]
MKIRIGGAFDLQPLRILFLFTAAFLVISPFIEQYKKDRGQDIKIQTNYEKYLIAYILTASAVYIYHFAGSDINKLILVLTTLPTFVLVYFMLKKTGDQGMKDAFKLSLISVAVISSLVAIVQFVGDQSFFRVNPDYDRPAFAGLLRSTGVFRDDYLHSYVVFTALVWVAFSDFKTWKKNALMGLFFLSIFLAFMRMGYVVAAIFAVHAVIYASNATFKLKVLVVTLAAIFGVFSIFAVISSGILESSVAQERMMDEGTMELRFALFEKAIQVSFSDIQGLLLGYGGPESEVYYNAIFEVTGSQTWAMGNKGGWHNLFIEIMFYTGLPTLILFAIFLVGIGKYYHRIAKSTSHFEYYIPFYITIGYFVANLTLGLGLETNFAIILSISAAILINQRKTQLQETQVHDLTKV